MAPFLDRHLDVYQYVLRGLRLPIPELSLKEVARYFGVPRVSNVIDGLDAQMKYEDYHLTKGAERKVLRQELTSYNRDDLEALIEVADRVRELMKSAEPIKLPRTRKRRRHYSVSAVPAPSGELSWSRHIKLCAVCLHAARGRGSDATFCSVGLRLIDSLGA